MPPPATAMRIFGGEMEPMACVFQRVFEDRKREAGKSFAELVW